LANGTPKALLFYGRFIMYKKMLERRGKKSDSKEALERAARRLAEH